MIVDHQQPPPTSARNCSPGREQLCDADAGLWVGAQITEDPVQIGACEGRGRGAIETAAEILAHRLQRRQVDQPVFANIQECRRGGLRGKSAELPNFRP